MFGSFEKVLSCLSDLCKKNQKKILMYDDLIAVFSACPFLARRCPELVFLKRATRCRCSQRAPRHGLWRMGVSSADRGVSPG